jgi:hypothetical protein
MRLGSIINIAEAKQMNGMLPTTKTFNMSENLNCDNILTSLPIVRLKLRKQYKKCQNKMNTIDNVVRKSNKPGKEHQI